MSTGPLSLQPSSRRTNAAFGPTAPPLVQSQLQTEVALVTTQTPAPLVRFSFGRQADNRDVSEEEEPEHQRMMTQRARVQIKNYLPTAENEGDAIEKLRAKVESFQNRNRARG